MEQFLKELQESGKVLVAGSYARGEQTEFSDIDFFIKTPRDTVLYGGMNPNVRFVMELLEKYGIKANSTRTSYISTIGEQNDIPIEMEFYDDFYPQKNKLKEVTILGITFKTR